MRRLATLLLALSLAVPLPAWAGQWNNVSLAGAGITESDAIIAKCDSSHVVAISKAATSGTGAGRLYTWTSGVPSVAAFNLPAPSSSPYGHATYLYCNSTIIQVAGSAYPSQGRWLYSSTIASPGTWTLRADVGSGAGYNGYTGVGGDGPGAYPYTVGYMHATYQLQIFNWDYANYDADYVNVDGGGAAVTEPRRCSGSRVSSTLYGLGCWANNGNFRGGYNGTSNTNQFASIDCNASGGASWKAEQSWSTNGAWFLLGDDGTNSHVCGIAWNGSAASRLASQSISGKTFRGGAYFGGEYLVWETTGAAWVGAQGAYNAWFADRSSSSLDLAPDSGTVIFVVEGIDADGDSDATDNLVAFFGSGNISYYGEAVSSGARPRRSSLSGTLGGSMRGGL